MSGFQLVFLKHGNTTFELMAKPGKVLAWRKAGAQGRASDLLECDTIFSNQSMAEKAKDSDLVDVFGTDNQEECIRQILEKGEVHLSAAERKELVEKRKREVINYLHKYYIDPRYKKPHPVARLENALKEIKYHVTAEAPVDKQVNDIMKKLPEVLPMKKCELIAHLTVPHAYTGATERIVRQYVKVLKENWTATGCEMEVSLVPGDYEALLAELQNATKGDFSFELEGNFGAAAEEAPAAAAGGKKGRKGKKKR